MHYAGEVIYDVHNFLSKNKDTIYADLISLMQGSKHDLIRSLFSETEAIPQKKDLKGPAGPAKKLQSKKVTLGTQFRVHHPTSSEI